MTAALEEDKWSAARPGRTLPPGKTRYPFLQEAEWASGSVWTDGKSRPHRDSIPDSPPRNSITKLTELWGQHKVGVIIYRNVRKYITTQNGLAQTNKY